MKQGKAIKADLLAGVAARAISLPTFKPPRPPTLADKLIRDVARIKGAEEHAQFVRLLGKATRYVLSAATTEAVAQTLRRAPVTVERNVDLMNLREDVTWIECDDLPRRVLGAPPPRVGAVLPERVGMLVARDENNSDRFAVVTAWELPDGSVRHSYAVASFEASELAVLAWYARNRHSADPMDSMNRMIGSVSVVIPPGLDKEIQVIEEMDRPHGWEAAYGRTARNAALDVTSEIPFLYAALVALGTEQAVFMAREDARHVDVKVEFAARSRLPFLRNRTGYVRTGPKAAPVVRWHEPYRAKAP